MTCPAWTASSGCPTPRTGSITTSTSASTSCSSTSSPPPGQPGTNQGRSQRFRGYEGQTGSGGWTHANDNDDLLSLRGDGRLPGPAHRPRVIDSITGNWP